MSRNFTFQEDWGGGGISVLGEKATPQINTTFYSPERYDLLQRMMLLSKDILEYWTNEKDKMIRVQETIVNMRLYFDCNFSFSRFEFILKNFFNL